MRLNDLLKGKQDEIDNFRNEQNQYEIKISKFENLQP